MINAYKFGSFTLDFQKESLFYGEDLLKINARAFQVLKLLVENAGEIISKEEFFAKVWEGNAVEDNNLTVTLAQIRKILGETKENKFIETVPKKGYRFVKEVEPIFENWENGLPENTGKSSANKGFFAAFGARKILFAIGLLLVVFVVGAFWRQGFFTKRSEPFQSVAVLPFAVEQKTSANQVFAEKLTQELIFNLGRITETRLSGFDAVTAFSSPESDLKKAAETLQVEGLVTGNIKTENGANELEIKINDLRSGETVFAKKYSLKAQDLADSQYRIARDIARELGKNVASLEAKPTINFEAYQAYLEGRHNLTKDSSKDYEKAIENFTEAVLKDAGFADAHSAMATAYIKHGIAVYGARGLSASRKSFPAAKESALKALELKSDSDEALAALGFVNFRHEYDWKSAEENFRKAIEINPNNVQARRWFGEFLHRSGRFDEGFAEQQRALALEPNSARILSEIAWGNYLARRFDEAEKFANKSLFIDKEHASTLYNLSEIHEQKSNLKESVELWKEAMHIEAAARRWIANIEQKYQTEGKTGFVKAKAEWLEDLIEKDYVYPTDLAKCYAVLGDKDKAIKWLEKGIEARVPDILSVKYAPAFDNLQTDARYQKILEKMNFPK